MPSDMEGVKRWLQYIVPSAVLGMMSVAFSVGLYVGRNEINVELTELRQRVEAHSNSPRHAGAVSADVLNVRFNDLERRLDRIEKAIEAR